MTTTYVPTGEPTLCRKFQLTNLDGNNNKFWMVETWPVSDGTVFSRVTYGRVGTMPQIDEKITSAAAIERKIKEKLGKGYQEVRLHRPTVIAAAPAPVSPIEPQVQRLIDWIFAEAGENIATFLAVGVDALSQEQIERGRKLLMLAQRQYEIWQQAPSQTTSSALAATVQSYYNTIPTQLPSRIKTEQAVQQLCQQFDLQEDRLNQLEAAIATNLVQQSNPQVSRYDALGAEIALLPQNDQRYQEVCDYIERTCVHGYRVRIRDIFTITVPDERRAFEQNTRGRSRIELLFHGTPSQNVRHILRTGLICPQTASHGRMFGHGIYFANKSTKSTNYCSVRRRGAPHFLFLADVAIGRPFLAHDAMPDRRKAPWRYDSVLGQAGYTGAWGGKLQFDEHIVYSAAQQTLRYLVTFDR
jgi:poly [ADP-ribose] polymerase 2/3/4